MRRLFFLFTMLAILLAGCGPLVSDSRALTHVPGTELPQPVARTPLPTASPTPLISTRPEELRGVEIRVWHGLDGTSASLLEQMATEFSLSNQWGIKVSLQPEGNLTQLAGAVNDSITAGAAPDVILALPEQILGWKDHVLDLTPYLVQADYGMDLAEFPTAFAAQSAVGSLRYGVPAARAARFLFYNLSFAHDVGLDAPPRSLEDFRSQSCAGNAAWKQDADLTNDGYGGLALEVYPDWQTPFTWLVQGGGNIFPAGKFQFNTAENSKALDFLVKLRQDGCAWLPDSLTTFEQLPARRSLFVTGDLGDIADEINAFRASGSKDEWTVLPFPGPTPAIVAYGPDYAILKSTGERQLAAWLFIRWMLDGTNQARWSQGSGFLPVTNSAIALLKNDKTLVPQWRTAIDLIPDTIPYPQSAQWSLADKILADGYMSLILNYPNNTPTDVLEMMDTTIQDFPAP